MSSQESKESLSQNLYHGSVKVYFQKTNGQFVPFNVDESNRSLVTKDSVATVLSRQEPQSSLGPEYSHLLIPAMPCLDVDIAILNPKDESKSASGGQLLPKILSSPLIKTTKLQSNIKFETAFASGIRSCILKVNDDNSESKWFRLKGCGNNDSGFLFACTEDGYSPNIEIRGCTFRHTSLRELYMTEKINNILVKHNFIAANYKAHGWYEYNIPNTFLNKIIRCCSIFETLGDKRLGDHLLPGIELLLPYITDIDSTDLKSIFNSFPAIRQQHDNNDNEKKNNELNVMETFLAVTCELPLLYDGDIDSNTNSNNNSDGKNDKSKIQIEIPLLSDISKNCKNLENLILDNGLEDDYNKELINLWRQLCAKYETIVKKMDGKKELNLFVARLYYELGFECGLIAWLLNENDISWGTYNDRLGSHCNAHCNNYVILPKSHRICDANDSSVDGNKQQNAKKLRLLAPLDFDLGFFKSEYIDGEMIKLANEEHKKSKQKDEEKKKKDDKDDKDEELKATEFMAPWSEIMIMEQNGNKISLAGDPDISTGVKNIDLIKKQKRYKLKSLNNLLKWTLRDTMVFGFNQGYQSEKSRNFRQYERFNCDKEEALIELIDCIFSMSLILTTQTVA